MPFIARSDTRFFSFEPVLARGIGRSGLRISAAEWTGQFIEVSTTRIYVQQTFVYLGRARATLSEVRYEEIQGKNESCVSDPNKPARGKLPDSPRGSHREHASR